MQDGFYLDIVLFAMIAAFLVLRLRSVLGKRTGTENPPPELIQRRQGPDILPDNVVELPDRRPRVIPEGAPPHFGTAVGAGVTQIRLADPGFSAQSFLAGARSAFAMIVGAYAKGEAAALRPLLSDQVFANFKAAIDARAAAAETLDSELVSVKSADLVEAGVEDRTALVTVKFVTEQVNVTRDAQGRVVDGDPTRVTEVVDLWTFARDTRTRDPNWLLVATRVPEDVA